MKSLLKPVISILLFSISAAMPLHATSPEWQDEKPQLLAAAAAQQNQNGQMSMLISDEIRHRLLMLPYYGIFDWMECEIGADNSAVLRGQVTRPTLKSDAEAALRKIEGISRIDNQIDVLPISVNDDRIRIAVYRSIFKYEGPLFRYAIQAAPPIHIIVNNGRVTLKGVVDSTADSQIANMAANGISGVFEVRNELKVVGNS
jgi:hyperosmotically inducible periplasmic protein